MASILIRAPVHEPVTLTEVKSHLRVMHDDDDDYLSRLIKTARQAIETQTGLLLIAQEWSIYRDEWPEDKIIDLNISPITEIADILVYGADDGVSQIDPSHYYADLLSRPARLILRDDRCWVRPERPVNGIEIKLLAGFGETAETVPAPLREAMLQLIACYYAQRGDAEEPATPFLVKQLLQPYRQVRL